jgi:hypothetical protein
MATMPTISRVRDDPSESGGGFGSKDAGSLGPLGVIGKAVSDCRIIPRKLREWLLRARQHVRAAGTLPGLGECCGWILAGGNPAGHHADREQSQRRVLSFAFGWCRSLDSLDPASEKSDRSGCGLARYPGRPASYRLSASRSLGIGQILGFSLFSNY